MLVPKLWVTINDPEIGSFEADHLEGNTFQGRANQTFTADGHMGSAKFDGGRTNCGESVRADAEKGDFDYVAMFRLKCERANLWSVLRIDNDAGVPVRAVRDYTPCSDVGPLTDVPSDLKSVAWKKEVLYVHFGDDDKIPNAQYYDLLIENGEVGRKPIGGESSVSRIKILDLLTVRGGRGGASNAAEIRNLFNLDPAIKLITLTVK